MKTPLFTLFIISILTVSCKKDEKATTSTNTPVGCSSSLVNKLSCKVGGQEWCSNSTCFADLAIVLTINGMNNNGSNLTLELDDYTPGTYPITSDRNHILYTNGNGWESTDSNPGTLTITSNNTSTHELKGTFSVTLLSPLTGNLEVSSGVIDVFYTN
ncbi:MAG: DUF6252 family protein [Bacteroidia bacterium]